MNVEKPFTGKVIPFGVGIFLAVAAVVLIGGCDRRKIRVRRRHYDHAVTVYPNRSRVYVSDTGPRHRIAKPRRRGRRGRHDDGDGDGRSRRSGRTRDRRRRGHRR